jgi:hypothetical protein
MKLSAIYSDSVPLWNKLDRESRVIPGDNEVRCVYRQYSKKGSFDSISWSGMKAYYFHASPVSLSHLPGSVSGDYHKCGPYFDNSFLS